MEVKLFWNYIKYGVDQETWKAAKCHITDPALAEQQNEAQTGTDTIDIHYCKRKVVEAIMNLQDIMHKFFIRYTHDATNAGGQEVSEPDKTDDEWGPDNDGLGNQGDLQTKGESDIEFTNNDDIYSDDIWTIELAFDGRRNINGRLLTQEMQKYVELYILQEWAKLTIPTMEQNYMQRMVAEESRIKQIIFRKEAPILETN